jgi:GTP-binding protein
VWLEADRNVASLLAFRDHPHRIADGGTHGSGGGRHGRGATDLTVKVPEGTTVIDRESGEQLVQLNQHGDRWRAARAGEGGRGNARFLSNKRRAPSFAEQGERGEEIWYRLELKLFADVALVGFPNAGKSTLISVVSAAKPKIADYPFTTLEPNLGVVRLDNRTEFVMADIPGLIEGASEGIGLGHRFLRHVERARVLLYMLDLSAVDGASPAEQFRVLRQELEAYRPDLANRPHVVVGSKSDVLEAADWGDDAEVEFEISAVSNRGLMPVMWRLSELVAESKANDVQHVGFVIHRPEASGVEIVREDDAGYRVLGRPAERAVALSDINDIGALDFARQRLTKLGVTKALRRAGVREGDTVRVGDFEFEYEEDL